MTGVRVCTLYDRFHGKSSNELNRSSVSCNRGEEAHRNPFSVDIVDVIECANVN